MEANVRVQYNTVQADRIRRIFSQLDFLRSISTEFSMSEFFKYTDIEKGLTITDAIIHLINVVRKNVFNAVRSSFEDLRSDNALQIFKFIVGMNDFTDFISQLIKTYFNDQIPCVLAQQTDITTFIDTSMNRFMDCFRNSSRTHPFTPRTVEGQRMALSNILSNEIKSLRGFFNFPYIWAFSTKAQNDTAARRFNNVKEIFFILILIIL
jgi:hypothetical protein